MNEEDSYNTNLWYSKFRQPKLMIQKMYLFTIESLIS